MVFGDGRMIAPVLKKLKSNKNTFIERAMSVEGTVNVTKGKKVQPFDRLGECTFSHEALVLPGDFKPNVSFTGKKSFYAGSLLGHIKSKPFKAPYDGYLSYAPSKEGISSAFIFEKSPEKYILLSGVWGEVEDVYKNQSVIIKTQTEDLLFAASTDICASGELVVFPNPTEMLEQSYLEKFSKNNEGKIIYVGHYADKELLNSALTMKVAAILCGSASRETFDFAKKHNLGLGLISGFGRVETPHPIFEALNLAAYRHVFFEGDQNLLRIPNPNVTVSKRSYKSTFIKTVKKGLYVQVLQRPYFGKIGIIDKVGESSIVVKFDTEKEPFEVFLPNFFIVE